MNSKASVKLKKLKLSEKEVINTEGCSKVKGGGAYYCCTRNRWIYY